MKDTTEEMPLSRVAFTALVYVGVMLYLVLQILYGIIEARIEMHFYVMPFVHKLWKLALLYLAVRFLHWLVRQTQCWTAA